MRTNPWFLWGMLLFLAIGALGSFLWAAARVVEEWPGPRGGGRKLHLVESLEEVDGMEMEAVTE